MSALRSISGRGFWMAARGSLLAAFVLVSGALIVQSVRDPGARAMRDTGAASSDGDASDDGAAAPAARGPARADGRLVQLDRQGQEKAGVEARVPVASPFQERVKVYGQVLSLDRLTTLYNAALTDAAQVQAAEAKVKASRIANDRAREVLRVFSTAKAQAETAEAALDLDAAGLAAAQAQVAALRNSAIQDWGPVLGAAIASRADLATDLVRRKLVLVQISLPPGPPVEAPPHLALANGAGGPVDARLISEATQVDAKVQGSAFLYAVGASTGLLPGASVVADIPNGAARPGVDIPSSAVVWQAGKPWMYVRATPDLFERRAIDDIAAPTREGGYIVPATSLPRDKPIVVAGAQILLSQEMRTQIPSDEDDH